MRNTSSFNLHRNLPRSQRAQRKIRVNAHTDIGHCLCFREYQRSVWIITFTLSNVRSERYLAPKRKVALTSFMERDALSQSWSLDEFITGDTHDDLGITSAYCETCRRFSWELPCSSVISRMNQMLLLRWKVSPLLSLFINRFAGVKVKLIMFGDNLLSVISLRWQSSRYTL